MNLNLKNKNALVCASSAGIGKAIAKGLAVDGANVTILGRDSKKLAAALEEIKALASGQVLAIQAWLRVRPLRRWCLLYTSKCLFIGLLFCGIVLNLVTLLNAFLAGLIVRSMIAAAVSATTDVFRF